jgi:hypothetical protein
MRGKNAFNVYILQLAFTFTAIAVIVVTVDQLPILWDGLKEIILSNPEIAGFLMGIPLMAVHETKRPITMAHKESIAHSEFASNAIDFSKTLEMDVPGRIKKVSTTVWQSTDFDQDIMIAHALVEPSEEIMTRSTTGNESILQDVLATTLTGDAVVEFITPFPITILKIEGSASGSDASGLTHSYKPSRKGKFIEAGVDLTSSLWLQDQGTAPTAGVVEFECKFVFMPLCYASGGFETSESKDSAPWITIMIDTANTGRSQFNWQAPCSGRMANIRMTNWDGVDLNNEQYSIISKDSIVNAGVVDGSIVKDAEYILMLGGFPSEQTLGGYEYAPFVTNYNRGPIYFNKDELLFFRSSDDSKLLTLQFQFIPNFDHTVEFKAVLDDNDAADAQHFEQLFVVPWDMYITYIEADIQWTSTSDILCNIELVNYFGSEYIDQDTFVEGFTTISGNILGGQAGTGVSTQSLDTISLTSDANVPGQATSYEIIGEYYPQGTVIGVWFPSDFQTEIGQMDISLHIEGKNRVKTQDVGTSFLQGEVVTRLEEMQVI